MTATDAAALKSRLAEITAGAGILHTIIRRGQSTGALARAEIDRLDALAQEIGGQAEMAGRLLREEGAVVQRRAVF